MSKLLLLEAKVLANSQVNSSELEREILEIKIEGLLKNAMLEQQFAIIKALHLEKMNDAADFVRGMDREI